MREKKPDDKIRTSRQPHRRAMRTIDRLDERAESPLGRMLLTGLLAERDAGAQWPSCRWPRDLELERACYEAGVLYARVVVTYGAQIGVPLASASHIAVADESLPADGEEDRSGRDPDFGCPVERFGNPDACKADPDNCSCRRRRERYDDAFEAVMEAGQRAAKAVARLAVHREEILQEDIVYLVDGLSALARHFGLTGRRRRVYSGNAN